MFKININLYLNEFLFKIKKYKIKFNRKMGIANGENKKTTCILLFNFQKNDVFQHHHAKSLLKLQIYCVQ